MRLLMWASRAWDTPGGAERWAERYCASLAEAGHQVLMLTEGAVEVSATVGGVDIARLPLTDAISGGDARGLHVVRSKLCDLMGAYKPDAIHLNFETPAALLLPLLRSSTRAPIIATLHSEWRPAALVTGSPMSRLAVACTYLTCGSRFAENWARRLLPDVASGVRLIPFAVPIAAEPPSEPSVRPLDLLCAGRMSAEKGFDLAVTAFAQIVKVHPTASLTLVGDGPQRSALEQAVRDLGLADRVTFSGWATPDEMTRWYERASLVLMPSREEFFGLVAAEAAGAGRAVVAARVGGLPETIVDGHTGVLCAPNDAFALADTVCELAATPKRIVEMGAAARADAVARPRWADHVRDYVALLEELIAIEPGRSRAP